MRCLRQACLEQQRTVDPELVALAQRSLPHYMVPSRIVLVEALPLTPSGKVDRKQLPGLGVSAISTRTLVAPRSELEQSLAEIWWEVLQRKDIGVLDNFFDLGGHSLLATRVVARIRDRFQVEFSLRRLFDRPTIEGLAIGLVEMLLEREELATQGGGHVGTRSGPSRKTARRGGGPPSFGVARANAWTGSAAHG